jgi:hypothetical protein
MMVPPYYKIKDINIMIMWHPNKKLNFDEDAVYRVLRPP